MASWSEALTRRLISGRWLLLLLAVAAAAVAVRSSQQLQFDRSIEHMFAEDDPLLPPYRQLKETFGGNEVVMAVYQDSDLFREDGSGLGRLAKVSGRIKQVPGVRDVLSLHEVNDAAEMLQSMGRLFAGRRRGPPLVLQEGNVFRDLFQGYTHGTDGKTAALACMLETSDQTQASREITIGGIRQVMQDLPDGLAPGMIAGEPVMVAEGFSYVEQDGRRLGWTTTILLTLTILMCFRSLRWVIIPIAVVQLTILFTKAILVWLDLPLSMVSSMLTAIVTVVGVATMVHIIVRFQEARSQGASPRESLLRAGALLSAPIFWACATDAVGFASLMMAHVGPVRDFGLMMAIGAMLVIVCVMLLVPGLALMGSLDADPRRVWGDRLLSAQLQKPIAWVERRPRLLAALIGLSVVAVGAGAYRLEVETDFTRNFRAQSPIAASYRFVETHLGGAGVWDVVLPAPHPLDQPYVDRVMRLEQQLRELRTSGDSQQQGQPALTKVIGMADAVEAARVNRLMAVSPPRLRAIGFAKAMPAFAAALYHNDPQEPEQYYLRIMLRAHERQPAAQKQQLIERVTALARAEFPEAQVTGFFVLLTNLISSIVRDQWVCFAAAAIGVGLMMAVAFRSFVLAGIALIPNALPVVIVLGAMGWLGLPLNMGAAMIAAVSMGLSIDSSIHYLYSYCRARAAGRSASESLGEAQASVGRAVVYSTLALIVGFTALCGSQFVPTIYFGVLVSLAMLGGLIGNLVVLPLLLQLVPTAGGRTG